MDFTITADHTGLLDQSFEKCGSKLTKIITSLMIDQGSFFMDKTLGSRLYLLKRTKCTDRTVEKVKLYVREALQWLLDTGELVSVEVQAERDTTTDPTRIKWSVLATQANGQPVTYSNFVEVI